MSPSRSIMKIVAKETKMVAMVDVKKRLGYT